VPNMHMQIKIAICKYILKEEKHNILDIPLRINIPTAQK
jgi:hypothetical protein